ncbi:MAG TPA: hypothetical protein PKW33_02415 [Anaerolineaceae bacterium]|nr:hypothetical protein [Anaerolineaceae bacterium]HPN50414.1 hypothetical protein [Anaerolineaceae bacterium]
MSKMEDYRAQLRQMAAWDAYLLENSGLPGPRGNLELAHAVAAEGSAALFERYRAYTPELAPVNSPQEFLAFCGVLGLGKLIAAGEHAWFATLRAAAVDPRWRTREAVAMALQMVGDVDMPLLLAEMTLWSQGSPLEQRAAAAALCEPRLLTRPDEVRAVLGILSAITASIKDIPDRKTEAFQALRKGLAYCWSVAAAALPEAGRPAMEAWFADPDKDIRWMMRENLKKNRLQRMDAAWVQQAQLRLGE